MGDRGFSGDVRPPEKKLKSEDELLAKSESLLISLEEITSCESAFALLCNSFPDDLINNKSSSLSSIDALQTTTPPRIEDETLSTRLGIFAAISEDPVTTLFVRSCLLFCCLLFGWG